MRKVGYYEDEQGELQYDPMKVLPDYIFHPGDALRAAADANAQGGAPTAETEATPGELSPKSKLMAENHRELAAARDVCRSLATAPVRIPGCCSRLELKPGNCNLKQYYFSLQRCLWW